MKKFMILVLIACALVFVGCGNEVIVVHNDACWDKIEHYEYTVSKDHTYDIEEIEGSLLTPLNVSGTYVVDLTFIEETQEYQLDTVLTTQETYSNSDIGDFLTNANYQTHRENSHFVLINDDNTITFISSTHTTSRFISPTKTLYSKTEIKGGILVNKNGAFCAEFNDFCVETSSITAEEIVHNLTFGDMQYPLYENIKGERTIKLNEKNNYVDSATMTYFIRSMDLTAFKEAQNSKTYLFDLIANKTHDLTISYNIPHASIASKLNTTQTSNTVAISYISSQSLSNAHPFYVYLDTSDSDDNTTFSSIAGGSTKIVIKRAVFLKQKYLILSLNDYLNS